MQLLSVDGSDDIAGENTNFGNWKSLITPKTFADGPDGEAGKHGAA